MNMLRSLGKLSATTLVVAAAATAAAAVAPARAASYDELASTGSEPEYSLDVQIAGCTTLIARYPSNPQLYYDRGNAYLGRGDDEQAIEDYSQAIALRPTLFQAFNNRGNAYMNLGQYDKAIHDYTKALDLKSDLTEASDNREIAYLRKTLLK